MKKGLLSIIFILIVAIVVVFIAGNNNPKAIYIPEDASKVTKLAAKEVRKYIYQRTNILLPVKTYPAGQELKSSIVLFQDSRTLGEEESTIEKVNSNLHISGGSEIALLYGAYQYAELLGVRFNLHGDVIPDKRYKGSLIDVKKTTIKPLFSSRGLLPFHDFPEGPDLWHADMYKSCLTQMVKLRMNSFSMHTYPYVEPNVWIGLEEDIEANGNIKHSYPTTLANTARPGAWGYSAMNPQLYSCGAAGFFQDSIYASPLITGVLPYPKNQEEMNLVFNRTGDLLNDVFSFGKQLGIKFCTGLETPLSIPRQVRERLLEKNIDPSSKEAKKLLYEGIFSRIEKTHPLDYFWLWTPEDWTWGTPHKESVERTIEDVLIARDVLEKRGNPFGFGLTGWVLGPPDAPCIFDSYLPKTDFLSSLSRLCGQERVDLGYRKLKGIRNTAPILWLEDDPALTTPQFWAGRLRNDMAELLANECNGIVGVLWRTRSIAPNILAFSRACWEQEEWNPYFGEEYEYTQVPVNDIRSGGTGTNHFRGIKGTEDQYLFNTQRYDLKGYKVKVPNGKYKVTFLFSETKYAKEGERIFDIKVEGEKVANRLDVFKEAGRDCVFSITSPEFTINDYSIDIELLPIEGPTFMSAFIIEGTTADANQIKGTAYKRSINVGGGLYKDFEADLSEQPGNKSSHPRDMESLSLYKDYALHEFGEEIAEDVARIFTSLDGTIGEDGHTGFRMPRPAAWITGPGVIKINEDSWEKESEQYAFVDSLLLLQKKVKGKGNKERYDYWLNTFCYVRAMAELGCIRGELDEKINQLQRISDSGQQHFFVENEVLPVRKILSRGWEKMMDHLIATVSTSGELGTVINIESQTRKTYGFLTKHDKLIKSITGDKAGDSFTLSQNYRLPPRFAVFNERHILDKGEDYKLEAIILGYEENQAPPVFMYREMGKGTFKAKEMTKVKNNKFNVTIPVTEITDNPIEYYLETKINGKSIRYPVTSPEINHIVMEM